MRVLIFDDEGHLREVMNLEYQKDESNGYTSSAGEQEHTDLITTILLIANNDI